MGSIGSPLNVNNHSLWREHTENAISKNVVMHPMGGRSKRQLARCSEVSEFLNEVHVLRPVREKPQSDRAG